MIKIVRPPPKKPKLKAIIAKIKSVWASGKLTNAVSIPWPHKPAVP